MTSDDGRQTSTEDGRAEAARRHPGYVSEEARVREAVRDAVQRVHENPAPRPGPGSHKWSTARRNDAASRYA